MAVAALLVAALARPAGVLQPSVELAMQPMPSPGPVGYQYGNYHYGDGNAHPSPSPVAEANMADMRRWGDVAKRLSAQLLAATDELDGVPPSTTSATFATLFPPLPTRTETATQLLTPIQPLPALQPSPEASPSPQPAVPPVCGVGVDPDAWFPCTWAPVNNSAHPYSLPACLDSACQNMNGTCREPLVGIACVGDPPSICSKSSRGAGCTLPATQLLVAADILEGAAPRRTLSEETPQVVAGAASFLAFPAPTPDDLTKARRKRAAEMGAAQAERVEGDL